MDEQWFFMNNDNDEWIRDRFHPPSEDEQKRISADVAKYVDKMRGNVKKPEAMLALFVPENIHPDFRTLWYLACQEKHSFLKNRDAFRDIL